MKKTIKRMLALMTAVIMCMALALPAFADENVNVTIANDDVIKDHTYTAYKIFGGTQGADNVLGDVVWGGDVNPSGLITALVDLKDNSAFTALTYTVGETSTNVGAELGKLSYNTQDPNASALALASILGHISSSSGANLFGQTVRDNLVADATGIEITKTTTSFPVGYYLIVDTTDLAEGEVKNAAMLQATTDIAITLKTDKPNQEKKVGENTKYQQSDNKSAAISTGENDKYGTAMNDTADYTIGDDVPFKLYSKVPNMTQYETYKFAFHDTMSEGLTFNADSLEVYVGGKKITKGTDYEVVTAAESGKMFTEGDTFTVEFANLKTVSGANTGVEIRVEFTAKLNEKAKIGQTDPGNTNQSLIEYSNNPDDKGEGTTKSTPDKVIVFTYELDAVKVDGADTTKKLKDAEFKLHNASNKWLQVYNGTETTTINGSTVITPVKGTVKAWVDNEADASVLVTAETTGKIEIIGLDAATYFLKETKAPTGYNILTEEIKLEVVANTSNGQNGVGAPTELTELKLRVNDAVAEDGTEKFVAGTCSDGIVSTDVLNNQGSTLPSTGGMGTTIFYVIGGLLVLAAAIVLISRKRVQQ